jgi:hypothetical protein
MANTWKWLRGFYGMANGDKINLRRHALSHVESYDVTADELVQIEEESKTVGQDLQYASNGLTTGIAFSIAIVGTQIKSDRVYQAFFMLALMGFAIAAYCGQKYFRGKKRCRTVIQRIRERQVGPVGEEGKELLPAQIAELTLVASPAREVLTEIDDAAKIEAQRAGTGK